MKPPLTAMMMTISSSSNPKNPLSSIIKSSIPSMAWPLRSPIESMPPLYYLTMDEMSKIRKKSSISTSVNSEWMNDVHATITNKFSSGGDISQTQYDYTILSLSLLLLAHGHTDECHNLITPYSWPDHIHTSYGPVRYSDTDAGVVNVASYIHSLVHRKEGWNVGELGMVGWQNADYWGNVWARSIKGDDAKSDELREVWRRTTREMQASILELTKHSPSGASWCHEYIPELFMEEDSFVDLWDPRGLHRLCAHVTKNNGAGSNDELVQFAEEAVKAEINALLQFCLDNAGYDLPSLKEENISSICDNEIDTEIALASSNRISSAHCAAFYSDGVVILRNLIQNEQCNQRDATKIAVSVSAGISTRLLNVSGCCILPHSEMETVPGDFIGILLPTNDDEAQMHSDVAKLFNKGPLSPGDALVLSGHSIRSINDGIVVYDLRLFRPSDDKSALFVNTLHGGRGETPTTVVQWSKGTAHYSSS